MEYYQMIQLTTSKILQKYSSNIVMDLDIKEQNQTQSNTKRLNYILEEAIWQFQS